MEENKELEENRLNPCHWLKAIEDEVSRIRLSVDLLEKHFIGQVQAPPPSDKSQTIVSAINRLTVVVAISAAALFFR